MLAFSFLCYPLSFFSVKSKAYIHQSLIRSPCEATIFFSHPELFVAFLAVVPRVIRCGLVSPSRDGEVAPHLLPHPQPSFTQSTPKLPTPRDQRPCHRDQPPTHRPTTSQQKTSTLGLPCLFPQYAFILIYYYKFCGRLF